MLEMPQSRFEELVGDALDLIPSDFAKRLDNVVIQVADRNPDEPSILGLYHGIALTRRGQYYSGAVPDAITIYRLPILSICDSEEAVARQVAITVIHEIGHYFGIDDDRLHELGWG